MTHTRVILDRVAFGLGAAVVLPLVVVSLLLTGFPASAEAAGPLLVDADSISSGRFHSCAIRKADGAAAGQAVCWGYNQFGQLGNGDGGPNQYEDEPVLVQGMDDAVAVAAGGNHSCAIRISGWVECWGWNSKGQLGDGSALDRYLPVRVRPVGGGPGGLEDAISVSANYENTCAVVKPDGPSPSHTVCWGGNASGQLGIGVSDGGSHAVPELVRAVGWAPPSTAVLEDAVTVAVGYLHVCALLEPAGLGETRIVCWGKNGQGRVGNGNVTSPQLTPQVVKAVGWSPPSTAVLEDAVAVSAGNNFSCAVLSNGGVACWGRNNEGQLGTGVSDGGNHPVPELVKAVGWAPPSTAVLEDAVSISTSVTEDTAPGYTHSNACAVLADGSGVCWGNNSFGQLGIGAADGSAHPVPEKVRQIGYGPPPDDGPFTGVMEIAVGNEFTCAIYESRPGRAACWGRNDKGQLGDAAMTNRYSPVRVWRGERMAHNLNVTLSGDATGTVTSEPEGIICGGACTAVFNEDISVLLTAQPAPGSVLKQWTGCDQIAGTGCVVRMNRRHDVDAEFTLATHTLTVTTAGEGSGTVTATPPGPSYPEGAEVTLTASPGPHSLLEGWTGCTPQPDDSCKVEMNTDLTVTANFGLARYRLDLETTGNGSGAVDATPQPGPDGRYPYGSKVTLVANPGRDSILKSWSGCDSESGNRCSLTIGSDREVSARFKRRSEPGPPGPAPKARPRLGALRINPLRRFVRPGATVVLTARVKNTGTAPATGVRICIRGSRVWRAPTRWIVLKRRCSGARTIGPGRSASATFTVRVRARTTLRRRPVMRVPMVAAGQRVNTQRRRALIQVRSAPWLN